MSRLRIVKLSNDHFGPVSLNIGPGECVSISGPSGSGKTLMLRAIADLDVHNGDTYLDGNERRNFSGPEWRRHVGMLSAEAAWWYERVGEHFSGMGHPWLEQLGFDSKVLMRRMGRLSTGERQRLALVRLLENRPDVLLLDEPTASLDSRNAARVEGIVKTYREKNGAPVLWVGHDPRQIRRVADRHFSLMAGKLKSNKPR